MSDFPAYLKTVIDLIREPWKVMLTILLLTGAALFVAPLFAHRIGIETQLDAYRFAAWGWFGFSAIYLTITQTHTAYKHARLRLYLYDLSSDERRVIESFMHSRRRTANLISGAGAASAMVNMGILEEQTLSNPNNYQVGRGDAVYTLKPWIFRFFEKHPELYAVK